MSVGSACMYRSAGGFVPTKRRIPWVVVVLLLAIFALWSTRLADPFIGRHDNNTAFMTLAAQNYWRYGHLNLGFAQVLDADPQRAGPIYYYNNHPPLGAMLVSLNLALFGDHELSARLVIVFGMLLGAASLYRFLQRSGVANARWGLFFYVSAPLVAYYGQMVNHEPLTLSFFLLALPSYWHLSHDSQTRGYGWLALLIGCMALSGWQAQFFVGVLLLHALLFAAGGWRMISTLLLAALLPLAGWLLLMTLFVPDFWSVLLDAFVLRSGGAATPWVGPLDYAWQVVWGRLRPGYTEALLLLATISAALLMWRWRRLNAAHGLLLLLPIPGLLQVLIFSEQTYRHDYALLYFAPALATLGAYGMIQLLATLRKTQGRLRRGLQLILVVVLLAYGLSAARWIRFFYIDTDAFPIEIAPHIQANVPPGAPLRSNIDWWPAVWYYAERDLFGAGTQNAEVFMRCAPEPTDAKAIVAGRLYCTFEATKGS